MAILSLQAKDALARIGQYDALNCLQSLQWDGALNSENLSQLGDVNYDANTIQPEVSGSMSVRTTGSLSAFLSRMIYDIDGTGEFTGYKAGNTGVGVNTGIITESDLERAVFDLIEVKRANQVFDRAALIPRAHLSSLALSASTDGAATESYSFQGDLAEIYRKPFHDLVSIPVTRTVGNESTTVDVPAAFSVEGTAALPGADWKIVALDLNGVRVLPANLVITEGAVKGTDKDKVALSAGAQTAGISIPQGEKLAIIAYRKTPGAWPTITYPTTARFVKADQIDIFLVDPTWVSTVGPNAGKTIDQHIALGSDLNAIPMLASDNLLRVQSISLNVDLRRESLKQIKMNSLGTPTFVRSATYPLTVQTQVSVLESDLNEFAKLQGKNAYGSATPDVLDLASFENKTWVVGIRYYKQGTPIQTVFCTNARPDSVGASISTGGRAERTYSLTGSSFAVQGA